jgi:hypothetical protein
MMPDIDREERRKKRAPVIGFILFGTLVISVLFQRFAPGWQWVPFAVGTAAVTAVGVSIDLPGGRRKGSRRRAVALQGAAAMMMTGPPTRRRTGGARWPWCRG